MERQLAFVKLEVCGIQKFLCSTGKLKEMLGGSEIIESLPEAFLKERLEELSLRSVESPEDDRNWYVEIQRGAGVICLIMPDHDRAAEFLTRFSEEALERFPGLPLYGTQVPMVWHVDSYEAARSEAERRIEECRSVSPVTCGVRMLPVLESARLDGYPACLKDNDELVSVPSATRRMEMCLADSRKRLRNLTQPPEGVEVSWEDDLGRMLGGERARVALIHIDGNDLGKLFRQKIEEGRGLPLEKSIASMRSLAQTVFKANRAAFEASVGAIMRFELQKPCSRLVMPLRPLVMGGDDITLVVRADLALLFITRFAAEFERTSQLCGERLSVGAGMVVMKASYPFAKAFSLVESLTESAKGATLAVSPRPSSLDYLVLTEDVEDDITACRRRICTADDGALLTTKPFVLGRSNSGNSFASFVRNGVSVLKELPRSAVRSAMNACHSGESPSVQHWEHICKNLEKGMGGRFGRRLMRPGMFHSLFPQGFFETDPKTGKKRTVLGDFLELEHLLPPLASDANNLLDRLTEVENER